jgi:hypothetical protein
MRKDVREFIRRLEAAGLTVESTPGPYNHERPHRGLELLPPEPAEPTGPSSRSF